MNIEPHDEHFLLVLLDRHQLEQRGIRPPGTELEIGTGNFPRGMSDRRARELSRAGFVQGRAHRFGRGILAYPGLAYRLTPLGIKVATDLVANRKALRANASDAP